MSKKKQKSIEELLEEALVPEEEQPYIVPKNWVWTRTGITHEIVTGSTPSKKNNEYYGGNFPFVKPGDLDQKDSVTVASEYLTDKGKEVSRVIPKHSTLVCCIGSIGKVGFNLVECTTNQQINSLIPNKKVIYPKYTYYFSLSSVYQNLLSKSSSSTTVSIINKSKMSKLPFALPPLNEQKHIAEKVDRLFAKIDEAKRLIEEVKESFELRRAAILDKAFRGELTRSWRKKNEHLVSASLMLQEIASERKRKYSDLCRLAKINGEKKPRKLYLDEVPVIEEKPRHSLPDTWTITNIGFLAHVTKLAGFEYTKYFNLTETGDVPVIRAQNVQMGEFIESNIKYITKEVSDLLERSQVHGGEVLMVFIGAGTGNVCMAPRDNRRWHLAPNVAKITVDEILAEYLNLYLQSPIGQSYIKSKMKATAQQSLSMETIRDVLVYVPPLEEQYEIVRIVERLLDNLKNEYLILNDIHMKIDNIKQSILSKAFRGELGTNDPTDEHAIELLKEVLKYK